jgi:hypothetical protein
MTGGQTGLNQSENSKQIAATVQLDQYEETRGGELQHCVLVQPDDSSFWEQGAIHSRVQ